MAMDPGSSQGERPPYGLSAVLQPLAARRLVAGGDPVDLDVELETVVGL